jgi:hypothetical protein
VTNLVQYAINAVSLVVERYVSLDVFKLVADQARSEGNLLRPAWKRERNEKRTRN